MTDTNTTHTPTKPIGFFVSVESSLDEIKGKLNNIDDKMDNELKVVREQIGNLKAQLAAQWVVHGIMLAVIIGLVSKALG